MEDLEQTLMRTSLMKVNTCEKHANPYTVVPSHQC
jgi:hypothetical protein